MTRGTLEERRDPLALIYVDAQLHLYSFNLEFEANMAAKKVLWMDVDSGIFVEHGRRRARGRRRQSGRLSNEKQRLRGGLSDGVDVVHVDNGRLSFTVLPTRGMSLWKAWLGGEAMGWQSPVHGPVHPAFVPLWNPADSAGSMVSTSCWCGADWRVTGARVRRGVRATQVSAAWTHREQAGAAVSVAFDDETGEITRDGRRRGLGFHFLKLRLTTTVTTRVGTPSLTVSDVVENLSASPAEAQMLYHVNFGEPLLDAGAALSPVKTVVPRNAHAALGLESWDNYAAPEPGFEEQVYFLELLGERAGADANVAEERPWKCAA